MKNSEHTETTPTADSGPQRLPCRGCTADCSDYQRCDGRPWRTVYNAPDWR